MNELYLEDLSVSVVVPTKNSGQTILECLSSLFNQSIKPMEVIVVDGRSTDNTLTLAENYPVKVFIEEEPTSLPNARNVGIEAAKGEFIFMVDSDIVVDRDCIKNALRLFKDPEVIAVIPAEHNKGKSRLERVQAKWLMGTASSIRSGIGITAFAEFFRKTIFDKMKFDPTLGMWEDDDFQHRFKKAFCDSGSGRIVFSQDSKVFVHHPQTFNELRSQYLWYGRTVRRFLSKGISVKTILNLGSLLSPMILLIFAVTAFFVIQFQYIFFLTLALLIARNLVACYRSRSLFFFDFFAFEFVRSFFFSVGIIQGFFIAKRGK